MRIAVGRQREGGNVHKLRTRLHTDIGAIDQCKIRHDTNERARDDVAKQVIDIVSSVTVGGLTPHAVACEQREERAR